MADQRTPRRGDFALDRFGAQNGNLARLLESDTIEPESIKGVLVGSYAKASGLWPEYG
jgi:hypothetical protein